MPKISEKTVFYPITQENVLCVISRSQGATKDEILTVMKHKNTRRYLSRLDTILEQLLRKGKVVKLSSSNPSEVTYRIA